MKHCSFSAIIIETKCWWRIENAVMDPSKHVNIQLCKISINTSINKLTFLKIYKNIK